MQLTRQEHKEMLDEAAKLRAEATKLQGKWGLTWDRQGRIV